MGKSYDEVDVILIGAGIMSATLGVMLKELDPDLRIHIYERLDVAAAESSEAWNNAGTGHSAFCELNYTPQRADGSIDISKAVTIAESFEVSKQLWTYLSERNFFYDAPNYITAIPHISFVKGDDVNFLRARYEALQKCILFKGMEYTEDSALLKEWIPLMMENRDTDQRVAATRMDLGTDVNFGALTRGMIERLGKMQHVQVYFNHEVKDLVKQDDGRWRVKVKNRNTKEKKKVSTPFVFIGAGGGAITLLEKSGIPESKGFGGFPVSGQWLKCTNREIIEKHFAKVYGKASVGAPPMSVPHLDTRMINGKRELLFGPYAGFSFKFLKHGSFLDLPASIRLDNITPMLAAGLNNISLTKYLIDQVRQSPEERLQALQEFFPGARMEDWELEIAGQRVQVIKKDPKEIGILEFGTEIVSEADGSLAALLGASPGASTAVSIMISILQRCFKGKMNSDAWQSKLLEMIPSYGKQLHQDERLLHKVRARTSRVLKLHN